MLLLVNKAAKLGKTRHEEWNGKKYTVAPITLIVEGVLKGSKGPVLYSGKEIARHPTKWNGIPIVASLHPKVGNVYVSARQPAVLQKMEIGRIFNVLATTKPDGITRLKGEGWFEDEAVTRVDERILARLGKNEPIEQSVGLDGDLLAASEGSTDNTGAKYTMTVHNFRPDHVAILPDGLGACSIAQGCGVLANETPSPPDDGYLIVNPKGKWKPPPSGNAPKGVKNILKAVYTKFRDENPSEDPATKAKGAKIAWGAVKRAGWYKDASGKWKKRKSKTANQAGDDMVKPANPKRPVWKRLARVFKEALGLVNQPSHSIIREQLYAQLKERFEPKRLKDPTTGIATNYDYNKEVWIEEVFDKYVIYRQGGDCYKLGYSTDLRSDTVTLSNDAPTEVVRSVQYKPIANTSGDTEIEVPIEQWDDALLSNATKKEGPETLSADDYAYVPDPNKPSTWKLRIDDAAHVGGAIAAIGKGFRGKKAQIPAGMIAAVKKKIRAAWKKFHKDMPMEDMPEAIRNQAEEELTLVNSTTQGDTSMALSATDRQQIIVNLKGDCKCSGMPWKGLDDTKLNALNDDTLTAYENVRKSQETTTTPPVVNTTPTPAPTPAPTSAPTVTTPPTTPIPAVQTTPTTPITNRLTDDEMEDLAFARQERMRQKQLMVNRLTEHIKDDTSRAAATAIYNDMKPAQLAILVNQLPPQQEPVNNQRWLLAGGAPVVNQAEQADPDGPMLSPNYDNVFVIK